MEMNVLELGEEVQTEQSVNLKAIQPTDDRHLDIGQ